MNIRTKYNLGQEAFVIVAPRESDLRRWHYVKVKIEKIETNTSYFMKGVSSTFITYTVSGGAKQKYVEDDLLETEDIAKLILNKK